MDILNIDLESYIHEFKSGIVTPLLSRGHIAVHKWTVAEAAAKSANGVKAAFTLTANPQPGITAGITSPPCARNLSIVGGHADQTGQDIKIYGTDIFGEAITETIVTAGTATVLGNKAFKTVTMIDYPARASANTPTVAIGFDNKLGLSMYLRYADQLIQCSLADVIEANRATVTVSATVISSNTIKLDSALDGSLVRAYVIIY